MMKRTLSYGAALAALVAGALSPAKAETAMEGAPKAVAIEITAAWARATPGRVPNGAAYVTVTNRGTSADRLVGASSPVARRADLHTHIHEGGVMRMRKVPGIDLPPGARVTFRPGGYHVMLMGLKAPLKKGGSFPLNLRFEKAGARKVTVRVMGIGAMGAGGGQHGGHK